jgi:HK97 family phage major capsid protein/HK97 family phage prohead protease
LNRAYSVLTIKSVDDDRRLIRGTATTPEPDRSGDIVEPLGAVFPKTLPLLLHHRKDAPVGIARFSKPTKLGIEFEAELPLIDSPGVVRDRVNEAWDSVKAGLIRGVSIGFRVLNDAIEPLKSGGLRFLKTEILELSLVTVPANAQATLEVLRSLDAHDLAASGHHSPGVSGTFPIVSAVKAARPMTTTQEQITAFENTRTEKFARLTEIQSKASAENRTKDEAEREESDTLKLELKSIDAELVDLREMLAMAMATATPITATTSTATASEMRAGKSTATQSIQVKSMLPKGTAFTRYVQAKVAGRGSLSDALEFAKQWKDSTPEVELMLKAAVNPGTIAEPAWAAPLAVTQPFNDFLELLRPETLLGKIPGLRQVPFNISIPIQIGGGTYAWVGEGAPKPVGNLQFSSATLGVAKAAGIIVISEELAKISTPSAEATVRNDMIKGMAQYLDGQFIDPTVAAVTNVSPASITNLANGYATAGTSGDNARTDIKKGITLLTAANYPISEVVLIMSEANAFALATALTTNGVAVNPNITSKGGNILGVPVVTSQSAGSVVALVHAQSILYADDGGVNIDVSREASVEMNTAPTSPVTASAAYVSLWQMNLIGLRAERFINWKRARTTAVVYTTATYA